MRRMSTLWAGFAGLSLVLWMSAAQAGNPYPAAGTCAGLPQVKVKTLPNTCLAVVASDLKMPRGVLPLSDQEIWVTEMGAWERNSGRLSRLLWQDGRFLRHTVADKLDRPHGIALGKDGWIYVGEAGRIVRVHPQQLDATGRATPQVVIDRLPADGHHPLKQFILDEAGDMYLSMGAKTNNCEASDGGAPAFPCAEARGERASASIWKITSPLHQPKITVYARGLRNAMGMAWDERGRMIATDNGRDFINQADARLRDAQLPHDELNLIQSGGDYGWPYCYDKQRVSPEYRTRAQVCRGAIAPNVLLPAHSAPLGITRYPQTGNISALRGQYLIALHGYRDTGHRLIAVALDERGRAQGKWREVIGDWGRSERQPMGAPVEARVSPSGAVYISDDRNDALLRLTQVR